MEKTLGFYINMLRADFIAFCTEQLKELDLSQGLLYFLIYVGKNPGCSPGEMAQKLKADSGHTTRSIEKLVKQGFMTRQKSQQDKRAVVLCLTQKGTEAFAKISGLFAQWEQQRTQHMTEQEVAQLKQLLRKTIMGIQQQKSPIEGGPRPDEWRKQLEEKAMQSRREKEEL